MEGGEKYLLHKHGAQLDKMTIDAYANYSSTRDIIYFSKDTRFNATGVAFSNANWALSDYIPNDRELSVKAYATINNPAIVLYNSAKELVSYIMADTSDSGVYSKTVTISKDTCAYIRVQSSYGLSLFATVAFKKAIANSVVKKDYTASPIFFTVAVNQSFQDIDGTATSVQDAQSMSDVYCALYLPINYRPIMQPVKLAICCHGAGGLITASSAGELAGFTELLNNGYAILDVNGSNNDYVSYADNMGSPRTISALHKAYEYVASNYNVEDKIYLHGHSMGGLTALNFAYRYRNIVKSIGLFHPVTDLYNQAWLAPWYGTTKERIALEYDFDDNTGTTWEVAKVVGFNPVLNNSYDDGTNKYNFLGLPIKVWHGDGDTTVSLSGSQAFVTALKNAGCEAHLRTLTGIAHSRTTAMYTEELYWFNRF